MAKVPLICRFCITKRFFPHESSAISRCQKTESEPYVQLYCAEVCVNDAGLQTRRQRGKTLLTTLWGRKVWLCLASVQPQLTGGAVQANMKKIN